LRSQLRFDHRYPTDFSFWSEAKKTIIPLEKEIEETTNTLGSVLILKLNPPSASSDNLQALPDGQQEFATSFDVGQLMNSQELKSDLIDIDVEKFIQSIIMEEEFLTKNPQSQEIVRYGLNDFFEHTSKGATKTILSTLLRLFGPKNNLGENIYRMYQHKFFFGFIRKEEAQEILEDRPGAFLIRYANSPSLLHKGCFVLNVNKGNEEKDIIENYVLQYLPNLGQFIFYHHNYPSIQVFVEMFPQILRIPMENKQLPIFSESSSTETSPIQT